MDRTKEDPTLRDYSRGVWRRKGIVVAMAVVMTALALAYSFHKTPLYEASAQLIYEAQLNVADPLSSGSVDTATQQLEIANVASVIASPDLIRSANGELAAGDTARGFTVSSAPDAQSGQTVGSTVSIKAASPSAETAARAANAYAGAFAASRKTLEQARVRQAEQVIQTRIDSFDGAAARQTAEYLTLQQRLQDLQILEATVTGNFRVLIPATVPDKPFTPKPVRNGLMGFVAGLVLGTGLALLIEQFDTRVRTAEEAVVMFDMPLLGRIRKMPAQKVNQQPLVVLGDSHGPAAESIRKLRGNLEFANIDGDLKSLFITSCLQHEGKSVIVCNLALALAASGNRVVLVDGDLRRPQVHRYMDLPNGKGLSTVLSGKTDLAETLCARSVGSSLTTVATVQEAGADYVRDNQISVLTSGPVPPNPAEVVASKRFASLVAELKTRFDLVIVDAPALLAVGDTAAMARCLDGLIFLVDLTRAKRPLLAEAMTQISQMPCRKLGLVLLSQASRRRNENDYYAYHARDEGSVEAVSGGTSLRSGVRV